MRGPLRNPSERLPRRRRTRLTRRTADLRTRNRLQSIGLVGGLLALAASLAHVLLGPTWMPWFAGLVAFGLGGASRLSSAALMRLSGALPLDPHAAPELHALVAGLAGRAGLARTPRLYWLPRAFLNAFAVGSRSDPAIALSEGLLRTLTPSEVTAVLAHEVAHVRSGDMRVMLLAEIAARITGTFALLGVFLTLLNAPLVARGEVVIEWWVIALLVFSPTLSVLLQLALSRARERAADLAAVELTGDPRALASALRKIGSFQEGILDRLLFRHRHGPESPWLRTHPATEERVRLLLSLAEHETRRAELSEPGLVSLLDTLPLRSRGSYFVR